MTATTEPESPAERAVRLMGGPVATARKLGIERYQTVQSWCRNGIPAKYCLAVEVECGVSRIDLRPKDWGSYWPDLATEVDA